MKKPFKQFPFFLVSIVSAVDIQEPTPKSKFQDFGFSRRLQKSPDSVVGLWLNNHGAYHFLNIRYENKFPDKGELYSYLTQEEYNLLLSK